jgi:hypothetical protein
MAYINKFPDLKYVPLLIDKAVSRHPTYLELLKKVDEYNHPIIFIDRGNLCNVLILHYFSPVTFSNVYRKKKPKGNAPEYVKPQTVIEFYRNALLPEAIKECANKDMPKKIFLSRGEYKSKRLVNENQVKEFLTERGFTIINPEELSIVEQAGLFYSAEFIISDEGAALVNNMYCSKNTTVVCLMPQLWHNHQFTTIGYLAGAKCINLDAVETDEGRYHVIDMKYLERYIDNI